MIKAAIFDLDGTLVNSLSDLANSANHALCELGYKPHKTDEYKYFVGDGIPKMLLRASGELEKEKFEVLHKRFMDYYSVHYADETRAYDGMKELVKTLKKSKIKIAVFSNKSQEMAQAVVDKIYGNVFDVVLGKSESVPAKPDPTGAFMIMAKLGVNPDECVFLGDSCNDVATAVNCGALPVGASWGFRSREELLVNGARFIIDKPEELYGLIEEFNR